MSGEEDVSRALGNGSECLANHLSSGHGCALQQQLQRPLVMSVCVAVSIFFAQK